MHLVFTAASGKIILFLFKSHHFLTYFLYMTRYRPNNISRPVHDPPATPHNPMSKSGGRYPQSPRIDAPGKRDRPSDDYFRYYLHVWASFMNCYHELAGPYSYIGRAYTAASRAPSRKKTSANHSCSPEGGLCWRFKSR